MFTDCKGKALQYGDDDRGICGANRPAAPEKNTQIRAVSHSLPDVPDTNKKDRVTQRQEVCYNGVHSAEKYGWMGLSGSSP